MTSEGTFRLKSDEFGFGHTKFEKPARFSGRDIPVETPSRETWPKVHKKNPKL